MVVSFPVHLISWMIQVCWLAPDLCWSTIQRHSHCTEKGKCPFRKMPVALSTQTGPQNYLHALGPWKGLLQKVLQVKTGRAAIFHSFWLQMLCRLKIPKAPNSASSSSHLLWGSCASLSIAVFMRACIHFKNTGSLIHVQHLLSVFYKARPTWVGRKAECWTQQILI